MTQAAVLLIDLQRDFIDAHCGRMPVDPGGAALVLRIANFILARHALETWIPVLIVNQFPASACIGNYFRNGAAISGTPGEEFDPSVRYSG